jgi:hypothetical protein
MPRLDRVIEVDMAQDLRRKARDANDPHRLALRHGAADAQAAVVGMPKGVEVAIQRLSLGIAQVYVCLADRAQRDLVGPRVPQAVPEQIPQLQPRTGGRLRRPSRRAHANEDSQSIILIETNPAFR